jgi:ubiquinone/menaquinone biosynthesis C-methylase UbiE
LRGGITILKERIKVERISIDEFRMCGVHAEKSPYFLPVFRKIHWRRLDIALNLMLEDLDLNSKCVIMDLGCGLGIFTRAIGKIFSHSKIIGLDYTRSLTHVRKLCPSDNTMFLLGSAQNLPFESNSLDFIVSLDVLEHVDDPITALQEINRVLKDDGVFVVSFCPT